MMNTEQKKQLKKTILEKITSKSGNFDYNDIYQISWDSNCDFDLVKEILESLIKEGSVKKYYYNPYDNIVSDTPIGDDSYEIFTIVNNSFNISKLLD